MPVNRIDISAMGEGTEAVTIVETAGEMQFGIALHITDTTPDKWGEVLADLVRDMANVMAERGVHVHGRTLSRDEVVRMMASYLVGELIYSTSPPASHIKPKGTN